MSAVADLLDMAARVEALQELPAAIAREAVPGVLAAARATAAAGTTPTGEAWAAKKKGGRPLVNAAAAIGCRATGTLVVITLNGPEVFHDAGAGVPERKIIPGLGDPVPPAVKEAIDAAGAKVFAETTGAT